MTQPIKTLSTSLHKMDKLDKIDIIDSRQKSSENRHTEMVSELRSQIEQIKASPNNTELQKTQSYADILKTTHKTNKHTSTYTDSSPKLEALQPTHYMSKREDKSYSHSTLDSEPTKTHLS